MVENQSKDMNGCELCKLVKYNIITHLYFQNDKIIVVDCQTCGPGNPMLVWKKHTMIISQEDLEYIIKVVKEQFPNYKLRILQRQLGSHLHWHLIK